jgi:hypothetical protein
MFAGPILIETQVIFLIAYYSDDTGMPGTFWLQQFYKRLGR